MELVASDMHPRKNAKTFRITQYKNKLCGEPPIADTVLPNPFVVLILVAGHRHNIAVPGFCHAFV